MADAEQDEAPAVWCEECDRLVEYDELNDDGSCPTCGTQLTEPERQPVPWYFKAMIVATIIYLIWRSYQGIDWLTHHL